MEVWKKEIKNSDIIIGSVATCITILLAVLKGFGII
jgi:hypothetical protein